MTADQRGQAVLHDEKASFAATAVPFVRVAASLVATNGHCAGRDVSITCQAEGSGGLGRRPPGAAGACRRRRAAVCVPLAVLDRGQSGPCHVAIDAAGSGTGDDCRGGRRRRGAAQASEQGRYEGDRVPYGLRLVNGRPHPNRRWARRGICLRYFAVDPATGPIVEWMFSMRQEGLSLARITRALNDAAIPCPSAEDPEANPHRTGKQWTLGTVRGILLNPGYTGPSSCVGCRQGTHSFGGDSRHDQRPG